jgi:hypothetical protein
MAEHASPNAIRRIEPGRRVGRRREVMTLRASSYGLLVVGLLAVAAGSAMAQISRYQGQVTAIKVEECQLMPGTCKGSITLRLQDSREVALRVEPDTVMVRADKRIVLSEVGVGNYVMVRAAPLTAGSPEQAYSVILTTP